MKKGSTAVARSKWNFEQKLTVGFALPSSAIHGVA